MIKILNNKVLWIFFAIFFSNGAMATCPPPMYLNFGFQPNPLTPVPCTDQKTVNEFTGAAAQSFTTLNGKIDQAGQQIVEAYTKGSEAEIKSYNVNASELIKILNQLNGSALADDMTRSKLVHEAKLDYMLELQDTKMKAEQSPIGVNVTSEELGFIVKFLGEEKNRERSVKENISIMKLTMDKENLQIPVKIKSSEGVCDDAEETACAVPKTITPGKTMEILFDECSREKRVLVSTIKQQKAISKVESTMQKSQTEAIEVENTTQAAAQKLVKQRKISCSPDEYNAEVCGDDLSKREYTKAIFSNIIINNGNISASNFYNPPMVGSIDGSFEGFSENEVKLAAQSNIIFEGNETADSAPPLVSTYKSSNQYLAAIDMVDNILNESAVANQPLAERKNLKNAEFQAGYLSRMASLSLSKYSLQNSINNRLGSNIQNATEYDRENPIRETFNGASAIDQLVFDIENDYKNIGGENAEELYEMNEKALSIKMLDAQLKQNKLVLEQILRNERIELLLATILANEYNSPAYTNYLNNLRGQ